PPIVVSAVGRREQIAHSARVGVSAWGEQENLHHRARRKGMDDGSGCRLDFRGRLAYLAASDPRYFVPHFIHRVGKQLPMKLLYASRSGGTFSQGLLGRRQRVV